MIYTVGLAETYERGIDEKAARGEMLYKTGRCFLGGKPFQGGSCWQTAEDAAKYLRDHRLIEYRVYGLIADWEENTGLSWSGRHVGYHDLLRDAAIVRLAEPDARAASISHVSRVTSVDTPTSDPKLARVVR